MPKTKHHHPHSRANNSKQKLDVYLEYASSSNPVVNLFHEQNHLTIWITRRIGKKLFWKLIFWFYLILSLLSFTLLVNSHITVKDLYNLAYIPGFIALFAYAYNRPILPALFWKIYPPVFIIINVYDLYQTIIKSESTAEIVFIVIVGMLITFVLCLGIYNYAFKFLNSPTIKSKSAFNS
jgi:hypothetical protein